MKANTHWAASPSFDLGFLILPVVVPFLFLQLYWQFGESAEVLLGLPSEILFFLLFTGLFDAPHIFQTFLRTHFDQREYRRRPWFHNLSLLSALSLAFSSAVFGMETIFITVLGIFGAWHILRQNMGFLRLFAKREGEKAHYSHPKERYLFTTTWVFFMIHEANNRSELAIEDLFTSSILFYLEFLILVAWVGLAIQILYFHWSKNLLRSSGPKLLFLFSQSLLFLFLSFLNVPFLIMIALATISHTLQYHGWMSRFYKSLWKSQRAPLFYFYGTWLIGLFIMLRSLSGGDQAWIQVASQGISVILIYNGFVLWHYFIDGFIWRFNTQPELSHLIR